MLRVQKLERPNKKSGLLLGPGQRTTINGLVVTNKNKYGVYVEKFSKKKKMTSPAPKKARAKKDKVFSTKAN
jgi:hypothetical protein